MVENSFELLSALMETCPDRIYFKDREGRFILVSQALLDLLGLKSLDEIVGKTDFDFFKSGYAASSREDEIEVMRTGKPKTGILRKAILPSGEVAWTSATKVPLRNRAGEIIGIHGITRDVTREHVREELLQESNRILAEKQAQMQIELELAHQIQEALLPERFLSFPPGLSEENQMLTFSHHYRPMGTVGGDFFTILPISENQVGVLISDVMGHGVPAALITAMQRVLLDSLMGLAHSPAVFLEEFNRALQLVFDRVNSSLYVTAFYGVIDIASGAVRFASAAHPSPLIIGPDRSLRGVGHHRSSGSMPLGMVAGTRYEEGECRLQPGDRFLLFTDGFRDIHTKEDVELTDEVFNGVIQKCTDEHGTAFLDKLVQQILLEAGEPFFDDVCVIEVDVRKLRSSG